MQVFLPTCDFNADSVVLHQYDKAINMLGFLGSMQAWHRENVKEFWEGSATTLKTIDFGTAQTSDGQLGVLQALAQSWYQDGTMQDHVGDMYKIADDPVLTRYYRNSSEAVQTMVVATGQTAIDSWYKNHPDSLASDSNGWYEYSTSDTYWAWNGTEWVKQPWFDNSHVGGWFYNVMNIDTCNEYGLSLWAKMIGIVLPEYDQDADVAYISYYYNKLCVWRNFIKASFFRLSSNGSMSDINKYFTMIFGKSRRVKCIDLGVDGDLSDVMTVRYEVNFKASLAEEAFLNIGAPNQATDGIFPHPVGVLAKCIIGVDTGDDTDWRLGLNEHNVLANTGSSLSDQDQDTQEDRVAREEKAVQGQNLQNLNFFEEDFSNYPVFSADVAYKVGDIVCYVTSESAMELYRFINAHKGAWNAQDVREVNFLRNGGYFAGDENMDFFGMNEKTPSDPDVADDRSNLGGQNSNNFDNGNLFPYDDEGEPEIGPFLGMGDDASYSKDDYVYSEFSTETVYSVSDKVMYKGVPYVFTQTHSGEWDATHVVRLEDKYDRATLNDTTDGSDGNKTIIHNG